MDRKRHTVAVLIDGGFCLRRYKSLVDPLRTHSPQEVARNLYSFALRHVNDNHLYKVFYYDCLPFDKRVLHPMTKRTIDFKKTLQYKFSIDLFEELKKKRKMALRLGVIKDSKNWSFKHGLTKELVEGKISLADLKEEDLSYDLRQKGVDMKIGIDIAFLTFRKLVSQIVLMSGDADFVPASKIARREGVDFILDPMWSHVDDSLIEHIDGLRSVIPMPADFNLKPVG